MDSVIDRLAQQAPSRIGEAQKKAHGKMAGVSGDDQRQRPDGAVAWVQEVLHTGADAGHIAPEHEWLWTGRFACHWEMDTASDGQSPRTTWGDGPVQVPLDEALRWAASSADRTVLTIGGRHQTPEPAPVANLLALQLPEPATRPFEPR